LRKVETTPNWKDICHDFVVYQTKYDQKQHQSAIILTLFDVTMSGSLLIMKVTSKSSFQRI